MINQHPKTISKRTLTSISATLMFVLVVLSFCSTPAPANEMQVACLALNMYHEARGEPIEGVLAVGMVTLNRVADSRYPNNVCDVVTQAKTWKGRPIRNKCQFSWYCDGRSDKIGNETIWTAMYALARFMYYDKNNDITQGATHYHAVSVNPKWAKKLIKTRVISRHVFYR